jgi:hypothetical protein
MFDTYYTVGRGIRPHKDKPPVLFNVIEIHRGWGRFYYAPESLFGIPQRLLDMLARSDIFHHTDLLQSLIITAANEQPRSKSQT